MDPNEYSEIKSWAQGFDGDLDSFDFLAGRCSLGEWLAISRVFRPHFIEVDGCILWDVHVAEDGQARAATDLPGGDTAARSKFTVLTGREPSGSTDTARLPDGTYVTYRSTSASGTPAISINAPTVEYETIHFRS